jgi:class 3 adenylate cyclase/sugar lactone lactonase YvrE
LEPSIRAILFSDLVGSTALATTLGDDRARSLIRSHYERVCEESIARHHGHLFKKLGDGILADFGSARQAILCATDIHQQLATEGSGLKARVAITVGEPVEETGDFFGTAVNAAQRAASVGRAGETVLAAAVADVVGPMRGIKFVELAPRRLKGLPPRQKLFLAADPTATGPRAAVTNLRSWPRVRWIALTGTFVFAALVLVGVSIANSPGRITLSDPSGIAVDASGRVYVVSGNRILTVSDGTTSIFAGSGMKGFAGDGGPAMLAELGAPVAVAVSRNGDVYIADTGNDRIRRVHDGLITTIIGDGVPAYGGDGGQATSAHLTAPEGVAVDSRGDIFVADNGNNVVRKVDSAGIITTVAGSATASNYVDGAMAVSVKLGSPIGIVANEVGDFWFTADQAIYHVEPDGRIHQIAGANEPGYLGDGGPATSAMLRDPEGLAMYGTDLFVADTDNERVRRIDGSGVITTVAGTGLKGYSGDNGEATSAQLTSPGDVGVASDGRLFIADTGNNHVRLVTAAGLITTLA